MQRKSMVSPIIIIRKICIFYGRYIPIRNVAIKFCCILILENVMLITYKLNIDLVFTDVCHSLTIQLFELRMQNLQFVLSYTFARRRIVTNRSIEIQFNFSSALFMIQHNSGPETEGNNSLTWILVLTTCTFYTEQILLVLRIFWVCKCNQT